MTRSHASVAAALVGAALAVSACGYGLAGRNVSLPDHVKTIAVAPFANRTGVSDLDTVLQKAVLTELQSRGRWKVVPDASPGRPTAGGGDLQQGR